MCLFNENRLIEWKVVYRPKWKMKKHNFLMFLYVYVALIYIIMWHNKKWPIKTSTISLLYYTNRRPTQCMIYSLKHIGDIISKIIFSYLHLYKYIILLFWIFFLLKNLGAFDWYYSFLKWSILFRLLYSVLWFFFQQLFPKLIIWISHSLKKIIMITKPHHKFTIDITQIIYRDIQIHNDLTSKIFKN